MPRSRKRSKARQRSQPNVRRRKTTQRSRTKAPQRSRTKAPKRSRSKAPRRSAARGKRSTRKRSKRRQKKAPLRRGSLGEGELAESDPTPGDEPPLIHTATGKVVEERNPNTEGPSPALEGGSGTQFEQEYRRPVYTNQPLSQSSIAKLTNKELSKSQKARRVAESKKMGYGRIGGRINTPIKTPGSTSPLVRY